MSEEWGIHFLGFGHFWQTERWIDIRASGLPFIPQHFLCLPFQFLRQQKTYAIKLILITIAHANKCSLKLSFRREQQLHCGEKASAKKKNSWKAKGGRVSKKYEVSSAGAGGWKTVSPELLSTSPESPVHGAAGPRIVVRN